MTAIRKKESAMRDEKQRQRIAAHTATTLISENVSFDFEAFLDNVGPAPSFAEPLGPTPECLTVDVIHSFYSADVEPVLKTTIEGHVAVCEICSGLLATYVEARPQRMPDKLFRRITGRRQYATVPKTVVARITWPAVPQFLRWFAVPALALLLMWILYPAGPYFKYATSGLKGAWAALRSGGKEIPVPNDPQKMRFVMDNLIYDVNRGQAPPPRQVERMLKSVAAKSSETRPDDPDAQRWATYSTQLAALDAVSHYEALRKTTWSSVFPLGQLKIAELRDVNGVPAISFDKDQVDNEMIRQLLEKSVQQSGIRRLYVYQGGKRIYDITISPATDEAPHSP